MRRTANKVRAFLSEKLKFEDERMEQGWIEGRRKEVVLDEETDYGSVDRDPKEYIVPDMEKPVNGNAV
jgi:hypothetical protein